jgi:hypothetical protein
MIGPFYEVFPDSEQARVRDGACRYQLLQEDADALVEDWIGQYVPPDRTSTWGPPDTSKVPIVTVARAMSTPGHYGREPRIVGDVAGLAELLRAAGWASKMQSVEYLAYGMNTCGLLPSWSDDLGRLVLAVCPSHLLWFDEHPDDPTVAIVQRRLQVRNVYGEDCLAWDVWDVSDPSSPVFRIVKADRRGEYGDDITEEVTGRGPLVGDDYPYRDAAGRPFAPVVLYRTHDDSSMWSWHRGKGAFRGSLMAVLYNSHAGKCARDAVSQGGIMVDAEPVGGNVGYDNSRRGVVSIDFEAGDILHYRSTGRRLQLRRAIFRQRGRRDGRDAYRCRARRRQSNVGRRNPSHQCCPPRRAAPHRPSDEGGGPRAFRPRGVAGDDGRRYRAARRV